MNNTTPFRNKIKNEFKKIVHSWDTKFPAYDCLRIDLHCHDQNSDVPDELWGRILHLPETWLSTDDLISKLKLKTNALTITNHNNARSCWDLLERGIDVLPGAEFTVFFPDMNISVHVLTYGFTRSQEVILERNRSNGYVFLEWCAANEIPVILAHPLFLQHSFKNIPMEVFERLSLLFERFEVLNGQRDSYQNLLVYQWVQSMNEENLTLLSKKHHINPYQYGDNPFQKRIFGGSDDHYSLFAGQTGSLLYVPDLARRMKSKSPSALALEVIRSGQSVPYGDYVEDEKLTIGFMDYFCQVALNMNEPGLLRMMLHRGTLKDKMACFLVSNVMQEIRRHKYTTSFLTVFHEALLGHKPTLLMNLSMSKDYRPLLEDITSIAKANKLDGEEKHLQIIQAIDQMFLKMNRLIVKRVQKQKKAEEKENWTIPLDVDSFVKQFEIPSHWRSLIHHEDSSKNMKSFNLNAWFDQLSFPTLAASLLLGARFASTRIMNNDRETLQNFASKIGADCPEERVLWLTDTLFDKNGVASVLQETLKEIRRRELPIDLLVCNNDLSPEDHLQVVPSLGSFSLSQFSDFKFNVPNLLDIHRIFQEGAYDRIVVSTEFFMGGVGLFLQKAFNVPVYLFMHTDWMDYIKTNTELDPSNLDRIRRFCRAFYSQFDGIFVLNSQHKNWLTSPAMGISSEKIFKTAHWNGSHFKPFDNKKEVNKESPVFLYVGRLSEEKGVFDLPLIFSNIKEVFPKAILQIAGTGNAEKELKEEMPDAVFLGWVDHQDLPSIYSGADMLLLPSYFDTFGCVVTEAMSCGLPVAAYDCKGPKDIISNGVDGVLGADKESLAKAIIEVFKNGKAWEMSRAALEKASLYQPEEIMNQMMLDLKLKSQISKSPA